MLLFILSVGGQLHSNQSAVLLFAVIVFLQLLAVSSHRQQSD